jgi:DNA topoisomerase-2
VQFPKNTLSTYSTENLEKILKINTTISTTNMHLFDKNCKLQKFHHVGEIIDYYCSVRKATYELRRNYYLDELERIHRKTSNKVRFILEILDDMIDLRKKSTETIAQILNERRFDEIDHSFDYLIKLPMNAVSLENTRKMKEENENILKELQTLREKTVQQLWMEDLGNLERVYRQQFI